ncbi:flagellar basal body L-ring protein FlgH [Stakelama tenebrarum]|uniref:Flagellar L-ring protein n=1 Tax=Stakelama tenebrarum TaxID=2711215 RepID=A0A6G6Y4N0_9SPHN|nr:flagellar basal body L-ring protein FlgH [Sphingosinithalassobacter tenebrarum]QIG79678.1 flagellar basal body L-ring protein FlgH [Sphingosinithalassobacter tenebrarum]
MKRVIAIAVIGSMVSGCGAVGRLSQVGKAPELTAIQPVAAPQVQPSIAAPSDRSGNGYAQPVQVAQAQPQASGASLFRTGAGALFRDQRASTMGDILTIRIHIDDRANLGNNTSRSRGGSETGGIAGLLGLQTPLQNVLPGNPDPSTLVDTSSNSQFSGGGSTARSETIDMTMAAIVTQVLPNGNLVIRGRQEVRVNFEMRELILTGIVRPQDIERDNSIQHSKIAEARIIYGGRGQLTDAQQARWGQQIYDALFPF